MKEEIEKAALSTRTRDLADLLKLKLEMLLTILRTERFWKEMDCIDRFPKLMKSAKEDPLAYFKGRGIDLPSGVRIGVEEVKAARGYKVTVTVVVEEIPPAQ